MTKRPVNVQAACYWFHMKRCCLHALLQAGLNEVV